MIILDTNVLSALMRPDLEPRVVAWANGQHPDEFWTMAISVLEIRSGILRLPAGRRKAVTGEAFERLLETVLMKRIIAFDTAAAEAAAGFTARRIAKGRNIGTLDTQIAGIVASRRAVLATRNRRDFEDLDIALVDPWAP